MTKTFVVYIMANDRPTLYTGMTNNLVRRVFEHKSRFNPKSFTSRYNLTKLVYFEVLNSSMAAIIREKQIKNLSRQEKLKLIRKNNPKLVDLFNQHC